MAFVTTFYGNPGLDMTPLNNRSANIVQLQVHANHVTDEVNSMLSVCQSIERFANFRFVIDVLLVGPICLLGLVGNTLSIMVMRRLENRVISLLFMCLAVVDNVYLALCLIIQTGKALGECTLRLSGIQLFLPYAEPYIWPIASMAQTATVWMVVLITVDRYLAICRPFNGCRIASKRQALWAVVVIVAASVVFNVPRFFDQTVALQSDVCKNVTMPWAAPTAFKSNQTYFVLYHNVTFFICRVFVPLLTVSVLNTCLIVVLQRAREERLALYGHYRPPINARHAGRSDSYTILLVAMVTVFILCALPDFAGRIWYTVYLVMGIEQHGTFTPYYFVVSNALLTLNSAVNCLIYSLAGRRFRTALYALACRQRAAEAAEYAEVLQRTDYAETSRCPAVGRSASASCLTTSITSSGRRYSISMTLVPKQHALLRQQQGVEGCQRRPSLGAEASKSQRRPSIKPTSVDGPTWHELVADDQQQQPPHQPVDVRPTVVIVVEHCDSNTNGHATP